MKINERVINYRFIRIVLVFVVICGLSNTKIHKVNAAKNDLSNPFNSCQCVSYAYDASPKMIKQLIKWTRGIEFENYPKPLNWASWNAGVWGTNIEKYGPQMDATLDWANAVNNTPEVGAIVEYPAGTISTKTGSGKGDTFVSGHVAVVTSYDPILKKINTSDKNVVPCSMSTRENVDVLSSMIFIHDPAPLNGSNNGNNGQFISKVLKTEFYSKLPLRNLWIKSGSKFELKIDGNLILSQDRPQLWTVFSKQGVSLTPFKMHSVELTWWDSGSDPTPVFDQTWWPNTFVGAAEPDPETTLPISYTFILNPNPVDQGGKVNLSASATAYSPYSITSIDVFTGNNKIGSISGSGGTLSIDSGKLNVGQNQLVMVANVNNWTGSVTHAELSLTVQNGLASTPDKTTSTPTLSKTPTPSTTPTPGSCSITSFNVSPSSPQIIGTSIRITGQAQCANVGVRAIRLLIDEDVFYEIGSSSLDINWNSSNYPAGNHQLKLEVAKIGNNDWENVESQTKSFELVYPSVSPTATIVHNPSCSISSFNLTPSSPQPAGTPIHITAQGSCGSLSVRAMRISINGGSINEIGAPSITTNWNTNSLGAGTYTITVQVAAVGDNDWTYAGSQSYSFVLTSALPTPTTAPPATCEGPSLSNPSNGALLNSPNLTLSWNSLSGASEYKLEIWGGDFGGNHQSPCGWSSSTSCSINNLGKYNYMWRVLAKKNGQECASQEWNFTLAY